MAGMKFRTFITFNVIGGVLWGSGVVYLGSLLGGIDFVRNNIEAIFLGIVALSVIPGVYGVAKGWQAKRRDAREERRAQAQQARTVGEN